MSVCVVKFLVRPYEKIRDVVFVAGHPIENSELHIWPSYGWIEFVHWDPFLQVAQIRLHCN